jgi:hypothetical protein
MGLLFALEPDLKKSNDQKLVLRSSKKKFGLAMGLFLGGTFLATMFYAAKPLFETFLREGTYFDKGLAYFFGTVVVLYPILAFLCVFWEYIVVIQQKADHFELESKQKLFFVEWQKKKAKNFSLKDLQVKNWKGSVNTASLKSIDTGQKDRYSTRGHWFLELPQNQIILERRARQDDIEWLKAQIETFFHA